MRDVSVGGVRDDFSALARVCDDAFRGFFRVMRSVPQAATSATVKNKNILVPPGIAIVIGYLP
jgi:hypothetical protein